MVFENAIIMIHKQFNNKIKTEYLEMFIIIINQTVDVNMTCLTD